jgi:hypothetical protein
VSTSSYHSVANLIGLYAERIDRGDFAGVGDLLAHAVVTAEGGDLDVRGANAITAMYEGWTRRYEDNGTPHTKHVTTNLVMDIDEETGRATCRSYVTVFQATDALHLQPVFAGRYHDAFERVGGEWRFSHRHMITDYVGDLSHHLLQAIEP